MKESDLKHIIYCDNCKAYTLRIPITDNMSLTTFKDTNTATVADFPYASYERTGRFVYNEMGERICEFELKEIHRKKRKR